MNKRGFEFKSALFSIIAISIVVIAFGVIISEQSDFYNTGVVSELGQYDTLDNVSEISGQYRNRLTPSGNNDPTEDAETDTFRGVYGIITGMFGVFDLVLGDGGMLDNVITQFGLPSYVRQGVITFLLVALTFSLVAVIFRLARRSA